MGHPAQSLWPLTGEEYRPLLPSQETSLRILTMALSPLDYRKWRRKPWYWRLFKAFKVSRGQHEPGGAPQGGDFAVGLGAGHGDLAGCPSWMSPCQVPVELVLLLTVPVVDPDKDDLNWRRPLNCLHILTSPLLCVLTLKSGACKSLGQSQLPGGDRTEMASKALGTAGALQSWLPIVGRRDGQGRAKLSLQLDTHSQGWRTWASLHPGTGENGAGLACLGKLRHRGEQLCLVALTDKALPPTSSLVGSCPSLSDASSTHYVQMGCTRSRASSQSGDWSHWLPLPWPSSSSSPRAMRSHPSITVYVRCPPALNTHQRPAQPAPDWAEGPGAEQKLDLSPKSPGGTPGGVQGPVGCTGDQVAPLSVRCLPSLGFWPVPCGSMLRPRSW